MMQPSAISGYAFPSAGSRAPVTSVQLKFRRAAVFILLLAATFGQRLCFPLLNYQVPIAVPLAYLAVYLILFAGLGRISSLRLQLYAVSIVCMIATLFIDKDVFSPYSFFYLVVIYFLYIFTTDVEEEEYLQHLKLFQYLLIPLAGIALLQLVQQFAAHTTFSIFDAVPNDFLITGYNTRPVLYWGSDFHKSNAEFFLEPSFLSQYMALGIILELLYFGSWGRMALYAAAIFASFSGTGIVMLILFAALSALRSRRYGLFLVLPVLVLLYLGLQHNEYVQAIAGRVTEFQDPNSSAYERFIGPMRALDDLVWKNYSTFFFGRGPGDVERLGLTLLYHTTFPVPPKLLIEYGFIGAVPFMAFVVYCFFARSRSLVLSSALFLMYFVLSAGLLQPHTVFLFYTLGMLMPRQDWSTGTAWATHPR